MGVETDLEYNLKFFTQFIIHPTKTGAILPSNEKLCELMTDIADLNDVSTVVELGYAIGARALRAAKVGVARNRPK